MKKLITPLLFIVVIVNILMSSFCFADVVFTYPETLKEKYGYTGEPFSHGMKMITPYSAYYNRLDSATTIGSSWDYSTFFIKMGVTFLIVVIILFCFYKIFKVKENSSNKKKFIIVSIVLIGSFLSFFSYMTYSIVSFNMDKYIYENEGKQGLVIKDAYSFDLSNVFNYPSDLECYCYQSYKGGTSLNNDLKSLFAFRNSVKGASETITIIIKNDGKTKTISSKASEVFETFNKEIKLLDSQKNYKISVVFDSNAVSIKEIYIREI